MTKEIQLSEIVGEKYVPKLSERLIDAIEFYLYQPNFYNLEDEINFALMAREGWEDGIYDKTMTDYLSKIDLYHFVYFEDEQPIVFEIFQDVREEE